MHEVNRILIDNFITVAANYRDSGNDQEPKYHQPIMVDKLKKMKLYKMR